MYYAIMLCYYTAPLYDKIRLFNCLNRVEMPMLTRIMNTSPKLEHAEFTISSI